MKSDNIVYFLYQSKEITKKQINPIIKLETIFMNSKNSMTSKSHVLILNLSDKLGLWRDEKNITLSNLSI